MRLRWVRLVLFVTGRGFSGQRISFREFRRQTAVYGVTLSPFGNKSQKSVRAVERPLDATVIQRAVEKSRIIVRRVRDRKLVLKVKADFNLGRGEAEAVALALQEKGRFVGVDDKRGINGCKLIGVPFTTAIAILVRSREKGLDL
jgi:hypothetical protein